MLASIFSLNVLQTALELGCIYALVALALFLSYSILNIADLSTDGCFTLGCAVACQVALTGHPILALFAAMAAGVCSGFVTAFLQTRLGVESIMAGIIVNTGLYTINLAVMGFSSTMSLVKTDTVFSLAKGPLSFLGGWYKLAIALVIIVLAGAAMLGFLGTRLGLSIRATGDNAAMVRASSINPAFTITVGLCISGALCALSGGVDSSVVAALVSKAIGKQLTCVFVDHGLMRKNEGDEVEQIFDGYFDSHFVRANAQERFLSKLKGVTDPEQKRKIIGAEFIRVFEDEARKIGKVDYLVQGTIYPDIIESGLGDSAVIKSHHNVGGLPSVVDFEELIEPLRLLFKDEVRQMGLELGLPEYLVYRQPFPGPGLGVRVIGEVTEDQVAILQDADAIFREEIAKAGLDRDINQYFAVITDVRSVGVMGDFRTYDYTIALRGVTTTDFMTADWARIPYEVLDKVSTRIVNEVKHVNRIVYDITSKPPATIEWE